LALLFLKKKKDYLPFQVIHRTQWKRDAKPLKIMKDFEIIGIVVGFPLNMNSSEGPRANQCASCNNLLVYDLPLCLWDERLSTSLLRTLLETDLSRAKRGKLSINWLPLIFFKVFRWFGSTT
jgi:putative transcription antitermination factor YqgF